ncbi:MAG: FtsX-like permease family protein [Gemmatimonadota bacterium]
MNSATRLDIVSPRSTARFFRSRNNGSGITKVVFIWKTIRSQSSLVKARPAIEARSERVAIISRTLAERAWPDEEPIGRTFDWDVTLAGDGGDELPLTVIGIVDDVKNQTLTEELDGMVYVPYTQTDRLEGYLVVRSAGSNPALAAALREQVRRLDPSLPVTPVQSLEAYTGLSTLPQRVAATVGSALGAVALLLSGIGIYGVVAFLVARRTREIGVRIALGADQRTIRCLIHRGALRLALPGLAVGAAMAIGVAFYLRGFLLGIPALDPVTFGIVAAVLLAAVLAASYLPGRRAASLDAMDALRAE